MDIYYNGVESSVIRNIMRRAGVRNACLSYCYSRRTPRTKWDKELAFLDNIIVILGAQTASQELLEDYGQFINKYADIINFAIVPHELVGELEYIVEDVPLLPLYYTLYGIDTDTFAIFTKALQEYFSKVHLEEYLAHGYVHGYNMGFPYKWNKFKFQSINTGAWLSGKYGNAFYFDGKMLQTYSRYYMPISIRTIARKLIDKNYDIDLEKIHNGDQEELAYMNLVNWELYARSINERSNNG